MRSFLTILICILTVAASCPCRAEQTSVKLGALYNLTGIFASINSPACRGSRLAAKLINEKGGILNGKKIELIIIDTRSDLKIVPVRARELLSVGVIAGLGYGDTDFTLEAARIFEKERVPFIAVGATDPDLPKHVGRYLFMTPFGDNDQAFAMADFAYKKLKSRNMTIWRNESTQFTRILDAYFRGRYLALGGKILEELSFKEGQREFSALVRRVKKLSPPPDAIFVSGNPGDAVPIVSQLRDAGLKLPILSGDGFDVDLIARLPKPQDANEVYFASHAFFGSKRRETVAFVTAYRREYGTAPESSFAALGYDSLGLLADAIDRAGSTEPSAVAKALSETRAFQGVTGEISFTRPSRVPVVPVSIVGVKDGKYRLMERWVPGTRKP